MRRNSLVIVFLKFAAIACAASFFGCGGGGAPIVIEPPAESPDVTPPIEQPVETPTPQSTLPFSGDGADWLLEAFPGASEGSGDEPNPDDNIFPTMILISGISQEFTAWGVVDLVLSAQDETGINLMALSIDGEGVKIVESGRLLYTWDTFAYEDGDHILDILARDAGHNYVRSTVVVEIKNAVDNAPPKIDLTSISSWGYRLSGVVDFSARATDDKGVTRAVVSVDGEEIYSTDNGEINFQFNTMDLVDGEYDLGITVYDALGNLDEVIRYLNVDNNKPKCTLKGKVTNPTGEGSVPCIVKMSHWVHPNYVHDIRIGLEHLGNPNKGWNGEINPSDGSFMLSDVPVGRTQFKIIFGKFEMVIPISLPQEGEYQIPLELTRVPAGGNESLDMRKIGVVTGENEGLEHTLAKLGYGEVDSEGALVLGTEEFSLIDGDDSLPDGSYPNFNEFIDDPGLLGNYEVLLIASGNIYERQFLTNQMASSSLKTWMENGGTLYCGGTSYDFLEQLYPRYIDFGGANEMDGRGEVPEPFDAAMIGKAIPNAKISGILTRMDNHPYSDWVNWEDLPGGNTEEHYVFQYIKQGWLQIDRIMGTHDLYVDMEYPVPDIYLSSDVNVSYREDGRFKYYVSTVSTLVAPVQPSPELTVIERLMAARLYGALYSRKNR